MSSLFLPPVQRSMRVLDRSLFKKTIPTSAARVFNPRDISRVQKECSADLLRIKRVQLMPEDPENKPKKLILFRPEVKHDDISTASPATQELIHSKVMELVPYTLHMDYSHWNYDEIINAVLPEDMLDDAPCSFSQAGHLAHLNLRAPYLPYKSLIAQVILDKNPKIKTVVNKLEDVGSHSVFRTFPMEVVAGPADTAVEVKESNCTFIFDFAKVYWNTRLGHEHERMIAKFQPGEAVCDVMAGVGPFAVPAGKNGVFAWANDLNPESYNALRGNIERNKVGAFVRAFNTDGRAFIRSSIRQLYAEHLNPATNPATVPGQPLKYSRTRAQAGIPQPAKAPDRKIPVPPTFAHFVMNLPASAVEFLDAFRGAYRGMEHVFADGEAKLRLPLIHVHTFHRELPGRGPEFAREDVLAAIKRHLGAEVRDRDLELEDVRRVAPRKVMYCASFRLPAEAAFADVV
ncbi:guanine(37)-N1-methyltransferase [Sphaerosporella brunnea]|uniref:tRNA (guanine(37)-N1)-methyltransferase n=1 Tax=Sphaerosporella brunnea TaxID=1250544 RepID=A0A5J5ESB9_9PEZI|nr:guanine(37)-N1-methyltransferase [Sphaerosporella brunnea]